MIYFFSGTPGSGKSLRVAREILIATRIRKQNVITVNMPIDVNFIRVNRFKKFLKPLFHSIFGYKKSFDVSYSGMGDITVLRSDEISPAFLFDYAFKNHKRGKESQSILIIDEAQMVLGPTVMKLKSQENKTYRVDWLDFLTQHRHLGFDVIIISQFDRLIDPQVRCLFEYNYVHRKVNNFGVGWILSIFKISLFIQIKMWYGVRQKMGSEFYTYRKYFSKVYDSYSRWNKESEAQCEDADANAISEACKSQGVAI